MQTGRTDLDHVLKISTIPAQEPVFVLRGQDAIAGDTVRAWAAFAFHREVPVAVIEQGLQQADAMDAWAVKKLADADHLDKGALLQLEYQFNRRAWTAQEQHPNAWTFLAEQRGRDAVKGQLRNAQALVSSALTQLEEGRPAVAETILRRAVTALKERG